jgi:site-specific DNA-cytosine methylase
MRNGGSRLKILIACEFSGIVRDAFRRRGHNAWSCDLLPSERKGKHFQVDVRRALEQHWDLLIGFPPCTDLCVSGAKHFHKKKHEQIAAFEFVMFLATADVEKIALENPVGVISTKWRKPDQIIQPWMFGHPESKKTCLWLKNLPLLEPTKIVRWKMNRRPVHLANRVHHATPGPDRWKERSRTLPGIADAMAKQWGDA